ncbi:MAG: hypothetical protein KBT34_10340 [Prevotella sp.]|nr:hypothetical protein [Candidatus Prevotella equi]
MTKNIEAVDCICSWKNKEAEERIKCYHDDFDSIWESRITTMASIQRTRLWRMNSKPIVGDYHIAIIGTSPYATMLKLPRVIVPTTMVSR